MPPPSSSNASRSAYRNLRRELALIDAEFDAIITVHAAMIGDLHGVDTQVASHLLVTVGDKPERISRESKFAALVGSPHPQGRPSATGSAVR
ncbi:hypothetical protein QFZ30_000602 [Arthrobacter pascens]|uniref:hypothetical protein n=1 Tax=Arthrobacter pascens TaxID=1677 RepID=UPI0027923BC6|nr:hypothetical protein [Arthrobacter pascens]